MSDSDYLATFYAIVLGTFGTLCIVSYFTGFLLPPETGPTFLLRPALVLLA